MEEAKITTKEPKKVSPQESRILAEILHKVQVERDQTAKWNQNWNQHTNKAS